MTATAPRELAELLDTLAESPETQLLAGGTDFMVEVNFGRRDPHAIASLRRVRELRGWSRADDAITLRAGLTFTEMQQEPLATLVPALAQAARTVGSPQIRNAGTLGGNLGTASPAGDALPVLAALDAVVVLADRSGTRRVPFADFVTGPKRNVRRPDEVIVAAEIAPARGRQEFVKVGTRNAMVISVASVALVVDNHRGRSPARSDRWGRRSCARPKPSAGSPRASTGRRRRWSSRTIGQPSRRWLPTRRARSTITARRPRTGGAPSKCALVARSNGRCR